MIMMSGRLWFMVVFMNGRAVKSLSVIFPLEKVLAGFCKRLLYVAWMDHEVRCRLGISSSLFQLILRGCLWLAVFWGIFKFDVLID